MSRILHAAIICAIVISNVYCNELSRGWGENVNWVSMEEGFATAAKQKTPILFLIHKTWCGACKALKPKVADSEEFAELSKHFVMINVEDDEEPKDAKYSPDGGYIPRTLFLNSEGDLMENIYNKRGSDKYKYYYSDPSQIISSMNDVVSSSNTAKTEL